VAAAVEVALMIVVFAPVVEAVLVVIAHRQRHLLR
jgi:hypothetical protein